MGFDALAGRPGSFIGAGFTGGLTPPVALNASEIDKPGISEA
jgi:hypothetical protein